MSAKAAEALKEYIERQRRTWALPGSSSGEPVEQPADTGSDSKPFEEEEDPGEPKVRRPRAR
jgi:hypothetical protein